MVRGEPVQTVQKGSPPLPSNMQGVMVHQPVIPMKQALLPSKQHLYFNNSQQPPLPSSSYDYLNTNPGVKYAELFVNPGVNPNMYSFDAPMATYPLDPIIPSYPSAPLKTLTTTSHDQSLGVGGITNSGPIFTKTSSGTELENLLTTPTPSSSPANELENLLKMSEADFTTLMTTFAPTNSDPQEQRGAADFAIPSANFGIFDGFPADFFTDGGNTPPSSSSPPSTLPSQPPMESWRNGEVEKWVKFGSKPLPIATSSDKDTSLWSTSSPPSSSHSELTPLFEAFPPLSRDLPLPSSSSSTSSSPPSHNRHSSPSSHSAPTNLPLVGNLPGNRSSDVKNLSFDEQLDYLDGAQNWDSFLPPMKRWQESPPTLSTASSPVSHMHISPAPTPAPSSPPSPVETKPLLSSIASSSTDKPTTDKSKPSPLLFGQSEDEILLKVLAQQPGGHETKPITRERLVSMPVEEFNRLLDLAALNEIEVAFMKEWRRRGKNKTAAMIARKRKREELTDLDDEVDQLRKQKLGLKQKYDQLRREIAALKERTRAAEERVYQKYSVKSGVNVSRDSHVIHVDKAGKVLLGPRLSSRQMLLVK